MPRGIYKRAQRSDEDMMASARRRLIALSHPIPMCGCWAYCGSLSYLGYGEFTMRKGVGVSAHRASYRAFKGEIPDGLSVMHRCDVRCCVNPDHLFLGTHADNMLDMVRKGRGRAPRGAASSSSKLTESIVREIRASSENCAVLGRRFGVTKGTIASARKGKTWFELKELPGRYAPTNQRTSAAATADNTKKEMKWKT